MDADPDREVYESVAIPCETNGTRRGRYWQYGRAMLVVMAGRRAASSTATVQTSPHDRPTTREYDA
jgi:hypothetical protein